MKTQDILINELSLSCRCGTGIMPNVPWAEEASWSTYVLWEILLSRRVLSPVVWSDTSDIHRL